MKPIFPTNQQTNQSTSTLATVLRYPEVLRYLWVLRYLEVLKCLWVPMRCHVCRFFDFSYHLLTALSQLLVSPRLQDLESLLTPLATVPTLPSDISRNFDKPKSSLLILVSFLQSIYFDLHIFQCIFVIISQVFFSAICSFPSRTQHLESPQYRFTRVSMYFPNNKNTQRTIFYPNFQFFD